jgi:hypothetical protein
VSGPGSPDDIRAWYGAITGVPRLAKDAVVSAAERLGGEVNPIAGAPAEGGLCCVQKIPTKHYGLSLRMSVRPSSSTGQR